ncbi:hypothetical protein PCANC_17996 [Puccinia coronata f. sp. avenae]|uniref:Uncharacterized protein n=1 Tax=Puccinia coronata f. sp. avenae TaxID=200324 RepID=A0A2N5U3H1_9BASI|nr:hypothetical protein PCANC_17996 [Puccinia coronata f. sp. avenae]
MPKKKACGGCTPSQPGVQTPACCMPHAVRTPTNGVRTAGLACGPAGQACTAGMPVRPGSRNPLELRGLREPLGALIRVPSGTLISVPLGRVPLGTLIRVPLGTLIRVPLSTLIRVPLGTLIRVPSGTLIRVPLGTLIRVPLSTLIRVPNGTLIRVPSGTLPSGTLIRVPLGTLIRVPLGTLIRAPRGSRKPLNSRGLREPGWTGMPAVHACPEGVQGLHALRTGVHGQHACPAGMHAEPAVLTPFVGVRTACVRGACARPSGVPLSSPIMGSSEKYHLPKLTAENFVDWMIKMKSLLKAKELYQLVLGKEPTKVRGNDGKLYDVDQSLRLDKAHALIITRVHSSISGRVCKDGANDDPQILWKNILAFENIQDFISKFWDGVAVLQSLDATVDETILGHIIQMKIPHNLSHVQNAIIASRTTSTSKVTYESVLEILDSQVKADTSSISVQKKPAESIEIDDATALLTEHDHCPPGKHLKTATHLAARCFSLHPNLLKKYREQLNGQFKEAEAHLASAKDPVLGLTTAFSGLSSNALDDDNQSNGHKSLASLLVILLFAKGGVRFLAHPFFCSQSPSPSPPLSFPFSLNAHYKSPDLDLKLNVLVWTE